MKQASERMSDHDSNHSGIKRTGRGKKSKAGGLAVIVLVAAYSFAAPLLNERYGWNLPAIQTDQAGNVRVDDQATNQSQNKTTGKDSVAKRDQAPVSPSNPSAANPLPTIAPETDSDSDSDSGNLRYGLLREVSRDRFLSPAGLLYTPGSAEGHRLEHLRRHTVDDPGRAGSHGVFDGDMEGALAVIDRAYERAKKNQRTTVSEEDGRTVYTVDMGGRVGFIGGQTGKRKRNPMARRVRLVVEGERVITAFPMWSHLNFLFFSRLPSAL